MRTLDQDLDHARLKLAEFESVAAFAYDERTRRWGRHKVAFFQARVAELEAAAVKDRREPRAEGGAV